MHYGNISFIPGCYTNVFVTRVPVTHVRFLLRGFFLLGGLECVELLVFRCRALIFLSGFVSVFVIRKKFEALSVTIFYFENFNLAWEYTHRRRYVIKPSWKDLNSFIKFYKLLKMDLEICKCRLCCSFNLAVYFRFDRIVKKIIQSTESRTSGQNLRSLRSSSCAQNVHCATQPEPHVYRYYPVGMGNSRPVVATT